MSSRWFSFRSALSGVAHTLRTQPNAWIELCALAVIVVGAGGLALTGWSGRSWD
ncbi:MAG: hypothetical protein HC802_01715 [Caldilineaceae bacterium]|nr:hypothetical protein [Caldilineaceae bacterium]